MTPDNLHEFLLASAGVGGALVGLLFVAAALLSLMRVRRDGEGETRDAAFLLGLVVTFVIQLIKGIDLTAHTEHAASARAIATVVVVCFLIGIGQAWALVGGPSVGIGREVGSMVRGGTRRTDVREEK